MQNETFYFVIKIVTQKFNFLGFVLISILAIVFLPCEDWFFFFSLGFSLLHPLLSSSFWCL